MERRSLRPLAARLVLLLASAVLALGLAEVAVRLLRPQAVMLVDRGLYAPDEPSGHRLNPGFRGRISNRVEFSTAVSINRLGLRGPEVGGKTSGRLRILVLGDSFAFGVGVEERDSYPRRMEAILRLRGVDAEVLNAGVPGYGIPNCADWLERHGRGLDPDLIVVTSFLGNDFFDATPGGPKPRVVDGLLTVEEHPRRFSGWLYYHSHLFVALKGSTLGGWLRRKLGRPLPVDARWSQAELGLYRKGDLADLAGRGGAPTDLGLERLRRAAGRAPVLLLLVPSILQVDPVRWAATLSAMKGRAADFDPDRLARWFKQVSRGAAGLPIADVSPAFARAIARGERIYYPIDQHLTAAGYALLGREAAELVLRQLSARVSGAAGANGTQRAR